ncbi:hypothetical protein D3C72_2465290 [compost metagenome]
MFGEVLVAGKVGDLALTPVLERVGAAAAGADAKRGGRSAQLRAQLQHFGFQCGAAVMDAAIEFQHRTGDFLFEVPGRCTLV